MLKSSRLSKGNQIAKRSDLILICDTSPTKLSVLFFRRVKLFKNAFIILIGGHNLELNQGRVDIIISLSPPPRRTYSILILPVYNILAEELCQGKSQFKYYVQHNIYIYIYIYIYINIHIVIGIGVIDLIFIYY